ncbi:MAG: UvrD-helicase domain-containing protein [Elusimicrobia bacterium]|nr:UvrD-helicase domain-containing protein [Elusimicrobiota bacterium]
MPAITTDRLGDILADFDRPILVRACAGSGKTRLLAAKCLAALLRFDRAAGVVAITFTEKAGQELKDRVRFFLQTILEAAGEKELELKEQLPWAEISQALRLARPYEKRANRWSLIQEKALDARRALLEQRLFVGTIHGFAKKLLDRYPLEALGGFLEHFDPSGRLLEEILERCSSPTLAQTALDLGGVSFKQMGDWHREMLRLTKRGMPLKGAHLTLINARSPDKAMELVWDKLTQLLERALQESRSLGHLDYDLILMWLSRFLETCDDATLREIRSGISYLLLDELQDTDPLQMGIIEILCGLRRGSARGGGLFMVGDHCQSIYSFRGASPELIFDEKRLASFEKWSLSGNKRSGAGLVGFVNAAFQDHLEGYKFMKSVPLREKRADQILWHRAAAPAADEGEPLKDSYRRDEARHVAGAIRALEREKNFQWRDMAILMRKMSHGWIYLEELSKSGIPVVFNSSERELLSMSLAVRVLAWLGVDLLGTHPLQCEQFFKQFGNRRDVTGDFWDCILHERVSWMAQQRQESLIRKSNGRIMDDIIAQFGLRRAAARWGLAEPQALSSAEALAWSAPGDWAHYIEKLWMKMDLSAQEDDEEPAEAPWDGDGVRLMTIHKAKGLQFPVVILPGLLDWGTRPDHQHLLWDPVTGRAGVLFDGVDRARAGDDSLILLKKKNKEQRDIEELRILYVALTRAEEAILVMEPPASLRRSATSKIILDALERARGHAEDYACPSCRGEEAKADMPALSSDDQALLDCLKRMPIEKDEDQTLPLPALRYASEKETATESLPDQVSTDFTEARLTGELAHAVLEKIPWSVQESRSGWRLVHEQALKALAGRQGGVSSQVASRARQVIGNFLGSDLWARLTSKKLIARELPVAYLKNGALIAGRVDVIYEDEPGVMIVADYKTSAASAQSHSRQGEAYLEALSGFAGRAGVKRVIFEVISLADARSWRL